LESILHTRYAVFFAILIDDATNKKLRDEEKNGIFVDYLIFGGIAESSEQARQLSRSIINEYDSVVIAKTIPITDINTMIKAVKIAEKYFSNMAKDIYRLEDRSSNSKDILRRTPICRFNGKSLTVVN